jgi:hypothetical protein
VLRARLNAFEAFAPVESATVNVREYDPEELGVPLICPVVAESASDEGKDPEVMDHVYGELPPAAVRVVL